MRIAKGKRYVTRDGRLTSPMRRSIGYWIATIKHHGFRYWGPGGRFVRDDYETPHPLDLVSEHQEPPK